MLAGPSGLDGSVQSQKVRLVGDIFDDPDDFPDLLGPLTEQIDSLSRLSHGMGHSFHPPYGIGHGLASLDGCSTQIMSRGGHDLGVSGHLIGRHRHLFNGGGDLGGLARLFPAGFGNL